MPPQPGYSRYIRTSPLLLAQVSLPLPLRGQVRFVSEEEAAKIAEEVRRRNVFARHSYENNFYLRRALELANRTVLEIFLPGEPADISEEAAAFVDMLEKLVLISSALGVTRKALQREIGVATRSPLATDFVIGPDYRYLRSTRPRPVRDRGVTIDARFQRRYVRCGFLGLASLMVSTTEMSSRLVSCVDWLFQSRTEPILQAAIAKTAVALETLLILGESEPLAHSLSERVAFILAQDPSMRSRISRIIKAFYDARSRIVHGLKKGSRKVKPELLEAVDRLVLLSCLMLAANADMWHSPAALKDWCDSQRWGSAASSLEIPFPGRYIRDAVSLAEASHK